jgi:biopolymer transport protein ExbD
MKFPRNARISRGQLDAAPIATVFFLLAIFIMLGSLVYTPGVHLELPAANDLPGVAKPSVAVAVDASGRYFYENELVSEGQLVNDLRQAVLRSSEPITLVVQADKRVTHDMLVHLTLLARRAGISDALLATLPRPMPGP